MAVLRREEVFDDWSFLLADAHQKAEEFFNATTEAIAHTKPPASRCSARRCPPASSGGFLDTERDFLSVEDTAIRRLKPLQLYINAPECETSLAVFHKQGGPLL